MSARQVKSKHTGSPSDADGEGKERAVKEGGSRRVDGIREMVVK